MQTKSPPYWKYTAIDSSMHKHEGLEIGYDPYVVILILSRRGLEVIELAKFNTAGKLSARDKIDMQIARLRYNSQLEADYQRLMVGRYRRNKRRVNLAAATLLLSAAVVILALLLRLI